MTTIIAVTYFDAKLTGIEFVSAFLPMTGGVQGYAQTYLVFFLIYPFVREASRNMTKNQNIYIILVLTVCVVGSKIVGGLVLTEQSVYCRLVLFVYIYFLMLFIKRYPCWASTKWIFPLLIFLVGWLGSVWYYYCCITSPQKWLGYLALVISNDEGVLLSIIPGIAFFLLFKNIKLKYNKVINFFASTTLTVLLLHDGHFSRTYTWQIFQTTTWLYSKHYLLHMFFVAISIYFVCSLIEFVIKWVESVLLGKKIETLATKLDLKLKERN